MNTSFIIFTTAINLIIVLLGGHYAYEKSCFPLKFISILTGIIGSLTLLDVFDLEAFLPILLVRALTWLSQFSFAVSVLYPMVLAAYVYTCRIRSELSITPWPLLWGAQVMKVTLIGILVFNFYDLRHVDIQSLFYQLRLPSVWKGQLLFSGMSSVTAFLWCNMKYVYAWMDSCSFRLTKEPDDQETNDAAAASPVCAAPVQRSEPARVERRSEKSGRCYVCEDSNSVPDDWDVKVADLVFAAEGRCSGIYRIRRRELNSWLDIITLYVNDQPLLDLRETNQGNWSIFWHVANRTENLCCGLVKDIYMLSR